MYYMRRSFFGLVYYLLWKYILRTYWAIPKYLSNLSLADSENIDQTAPELSYQGLHYLLFYHYYIIVKYVEHSGPVGKA